MQRYLGVKAIKASPMTRGEYGKYRGWPLMPDENPSDDGMLVEYVDGGTPNHPAHAGYISWSPRDVFDRAYRLTGGMTFGLAVEALKLGQPVARRGWNGKGMWLSYIDNWDAEVNEISVLFEKRPWIGMKTADDQFVPWVASQTDILAEDWEVVR